MVELSELPPIEPSEPGAPKKGGFKHILRLANDSLPSRPIAEIEVNKFLEERGLSELKTKAEQLDEMITAAIASGKPLHLPPEVLEDLVPHFATADGYNNPGQLDDFISVWKEETGIVYTRSMAALRLQSFNYYMAYYNGMNQNMGEITRIEESVAQNMRGSREELKRKVGDATQAAVKFGVSIKDIGVGTGRVIRNKLRSTTGSLRDHARGSSRPIDEILDDMKEKREEKEKK